MAATELGLKAISATPLWRVLPVVEPILGQPDLETGYVFTPGVTGIWLRENRAPLEITDLGLRGPPGITMRKPPGTFRVSLIGDSVVEALQVDYGDSFAALLQRAFNRDSAALPPPIRQVQVINLAMSGSGPLRALVHLEQRGYAFEPDLALLISSPYDFLTGELRDDRLNPGYVPDGKGGLTRGYAFRNRFSVRHAETWAGRFFLALIRNSEVARLVYLRSRDPLPKLLGLQAAARPPAPVAGTTADNTCFAAQLAPLLRLWLEHHPAADWQATEKLFSELATSATGRPVRLVYAMRDIPVPAEACREQKQQRAVLVSAIDQALRHRGIAFIDLESRLVVQTGAASSADLASLRGFGLHKGEGHLNHDGHRSYAEALFGAIIPMLGR